MVSKIGGGAGGKIPSGLSPEELAEIEALKQKMAMQAAAGNTEPVQMPTTGAKKVDRAGAQGVLNQGARKVEMPQPSPEQVAMEQQLQEKLKSLGYLPKEGPISRTQFEAAAQKFIKEHKDDLMGVHDIDDLFALLDRLQNEDNAKHNRAPAWNGQSPARSPGTRPPASTYANQGPSPNSGALQSQAAQAIATAHPPPPAGSVNARIAEAAKNYMGTSTAAGPDHGNLACAWSVNNILSNAGLPKIGSNPNYVPSVEQALQGGKGTAVSAQDAKPGDIVIFPGGHHIGIYMGNGMVANNSSSRAAFVNMSHVQGGMHIYRVNG